MSPNSCRCGGKKTEEVVEIIAQKQIMRMRQEKKVLRRRIRLSTFAVPIIHTPSEALRGLVLRFVRFELCLCILSSFLPSSQSSFS